MNALLVDLRYALRTLGKTPGFTAAAVATLALGLGANTAIFSVLDAAILRPLPVAAPEELAILVLERPEGGLAWNFSHPAFERLREAGGPFADLLAFSPDRLSLTTGAGTDLVEAEVVSVGYFEALGLRPALGRGLSAAEDEPAGAPPVAVVAHDLWRTRFGADPAVLGRPLTLNGQAVSVVGVAPRGFRGLSRGANPGLWLPVSTLRQLRPGDTFLSSPRARWLFLMGRLAPGVSLTEARAFAATVDPDPPGVPPTEERLALLPGARGLDHQVSDVSRPLVLLLVSAGLVLLVACANLANLMLARATARRREIAVRLSLGAGTGRLVRQLLTESVLLALAGGAAALVVAAWTADLLLAYRPPAGEALRLDVGADARVLGFALALSLATGLLFGLAPALAAACPRLVGALRDGPGQGSRGGRGFGLGPAIVIVQLALSLVLLVGAGLFSASLAHLQRVELGFAERNLLLAAVDPESAGYDPPRLWDFYEQLRERLAAAPGVEAASLASAVNPFPYGSRWSGARLEGYQPAPDEEVEFDLVAVGPAYFETLGLPLAGGRPFDARDRAGAPLVAVVNETMATRYWGGGAVGRHLYVGEGEAAQAIEVVGVARDGKVRSLREAPVAVVYFPVLQRRSSPMILLVRAAGDPAALATLVRQEVRALDPQVPVFDVRTLPEHLALATSRERMVATLARFFGLVALALVTVGVYGLLSYFVGRRTREIGIRLALGAGRRRVLAGVLGRAAALAGTGLALGLAAAWAGGRAVAGQLYGVSPADPLPYAAAALLLGAVALIAGYLPARRATRVDPVVALRD